MTNPRNWQIKVTYATGYLVKTVCTVIREKRHSGIAQKMHKNKDENNSFWQHLKQDPYHVTGLGQVSFLSFDFCLDYRRMKESINIEIFAHQRGMNIQNGMKKDACWTLLFP